MVHNGTNYLLLRGKTFHFRWRVPAELRSILSATELRRSLRTTDRLQAGIRAGRFVRVVVGIQSARRGYLQEDYQLWHPSQRGSQSRVGTESNGNARHNLQGRLQCIEHSRRCLHQKWERLFFRQNHTRFNSGYYHSSNLVISR